MTASETTCWTLIDAVANVSAAEREQFARLYLPLVRAYLAARWRSSVLAQQIDEEEDFLHHFDDVHYHPVKHGLVNRAGDWPWSSFHRWVHAGVYPADWGGGSISATSASMEHSTGEP